MKILFSPSETKYQGGIKDKITKNSFIFPELYNYRLEAIKQYQNFIDKASDSELSKLFGTKKQDVINYYKGNLLEKDTKKVIERYNGVAFDYLKYNQLNKIEQNYIDNNVIIFSNLFGPILCGDSGLPDYKLKQNEKIEDIALDKFYKTHFSDTIDKYLENEDIIDLRAGFYEKFYKIKKPYYTMKFIKNNKVISYWAKAYRGIVLKNIAQNNLQTIDELLNLNIENLKLLEIREIKFKNEILFNIIE